MSAAILGVLVLVLCALVYGPTFVQMWRIAGKD